MDGKKQFFFHYRRNTFFHFGKKWKKPPKYYKIIIQMRCNFAGPRVAGATMEVAREIRQLIMTCLGQMEEKN